MSANTQPDIRQNALKLLDAQNRASNWQNRMGDLFPDEPFPLSVQIPTTDLTNIVNGLAQLTNSYVVLSARLYLTFDPGDSNYISGMIVPYGYPTNGVKSDSADIILDVNDPENPNPDLGPDSYITAYNFTMPCPPLGCDGSYFD